AASADPNGPAPAGREESKQGLTQTARARGESRLSKTPEDSFARRSLEEQRHRIGITDTGLVVGGRCRRGNGDALDDPKSGVEQGSVAWQDYLLDICSIPKPHASHRFWRGRGI